jgi:anti-sigma factor RsiW
MPECREIVELLSSYLDRDLPPDTCSTVDAHLQSCPDCQDTADGLRRTVALCRDFRAKDRPGPLDAEQQQELRAAFEKALCSLRQGGLRRRS